MAAVLRGGDTSCAQQQAMMIRVYARRARASDICHVDKVRRYEARQMMRDAALYTNASVAMLCRLPVLCAMRARLLLCLRPPAR